MLPSIRPVPRLVRAQLPVNGAPVAFQCPRAKLPNYPQSIYRVCPCRRPGRISLPGVLKGRSRPANGKLKPGRSASSPRIPLPGQEGQISLLASGFFNAVEIHIYCDPPRAPGRRRRIKVRHRSNRHRVGAELMEVEVATMSVSITQLVESQIGIGEDFVHFSTHSRTPGQVQIGPAGLRGESIDRQSANQHLIGGKDGANRVADRTEGLVRNTQDSKWS